MKRYYYHTDHLGSTVLVTDEQGQRVWSAEYAPFGILNSVDGKLDGVTKFTGKDLDEDTGLYYFNARWYDQEVGRFITEDSLIDPNNPNLYSYVGNNPLKYIDPSGNNLIDWAKEQCQKFTNWLNTPNGTVNEKELLEKREKGEYWNQYQANRKQAAEMGRTSRDYLYDASPQAEYMRLVERKFIDPNKYSFKQFVNDMGPVWEAEHLSKTNLDKIGDVVTATALSMTAVEGVQFLAAATHYLELANRNAAVALERSGEYNSIKFNLQNFASSEARYIYDVRTGCYRDLQTGKFISKGNLPWPQNWGFETKELGILEEGKIIDRFGPEKGFTAGTPGASISERGLPPGSEHLPYNRYRVIKQINKVYIGKAASVPDYAASGGSPQYLLPETLEYYKNNGYLELVK